MRFFIACFLSMALGSPLGAQAPLAIHVYSAAAVPMRDGVVLRADIRRPDRANNFPTLVYRTPYDRRDAADDSRIAAQALAHGYAVERQDVRGRHASEGVFGVYRQVGDSRPGTPSGRDTRRVIRGGAGLRSGATIRTSWRR